MEVENLPLYNKFHEIISCCFIFLIYIFVIKKKKRKYTLICVSSFNSVNSVWMYNMETMPKMTIIITIILIAIMIKVSNYFHSSALINLKPIKPIKNPPKANDEVSSHFWFIFYMSWGLLYLT